MTNAKFWDELYGTHRHISVWPWSDVVSLVMRHAKPPQPATNYSVLELGSGLGANIPFFLAQGADYWGIDGSANAIDALKHAHPTLAEKLFVGDFTQAWPMRQKFDLILDRGSITHNDVAGIKRTLAQIRAALKPGGKLVAVDLFSTAWGESKAGRPGTEPGTRIEFKGGRLDGTGLAHFFDADELRAMLASFAIVYLEHKSVDEHTPNPGSRFAAWNLVAALP